MKPDLAPGPETNLGSTDAHDKSKNASLVEKYPLWPSKRFLIVILVFLGYFFSIGIKVCINIVIIEMTTNKTNLVGNENITTPAQFNWSSQTIGLVQSCFNYGALVAGVGGYLSTKFGGSVTYGVASAMESAFAIMNPYWMEWGGFYGFVACRTITGLFDGIAFASTSEVYARWIPVAERSRCMAIISCGVYIATAISYPLFGYIAQYWGWKMIFYVTGSSSIVWSIIWLIVARNEPSVDRFISKKEVLYIENSAETTPRNEIVHPYRKIFFSPSVWALCVGTLTYVWGFSVIIALLPLYVKDVTHGEVKDIGVISSIPNFACILVIPVIGAIMDHLQNNTHLKPNQIHKILMTFGFVVAAVLFIIVAFSTNFVVSMTCFILIKLFLSFNFLVLHLICLYMAPKHSSLLLGLSTLWWVIGLTAVPCMAGFIVTTNNVQEWSICFLISAGVMMFGGIVYMIYGSSELQSWAT